MGALSIWHILILGIIVLLLFGGRGKISDLMGDVAKGVKAFRQGMNEPQDPTTIGSSTAEPVPPPSKEQSKIGS